MRQRSVLRKIASLVNSTPLTRARRIVVKVGSALLVDPSSGQVNRPWLESLVQDLLRLRARKQEVVLVSSGAIALGRRELNLEHGPLKLEESQAAAAVGQIALAHIYKELFARSGVTVAQILLTLEDSERRRRYLNARATLTELIELGALPVINENDTVATTEIRYGDNDRLAARVAQMVSADCLLLLSDVAGLYTADPNLDPTARLIPEIRDITPAIEAMGGGSASAFGSGGMTTKIAAAKIATAAGCAMAIAAGAPLHPVRRLEESAECSWFLPGSNPENARKQWIAGSLRPSGAITIDAGALQALRSGKSLLPAGVIDVSGQFERGDTVSVLDRAGTEIARGMIAYNDRDAVRLVGKRSADIEALLGVRGRDEMIHRDDLVLLRPDLAPA
jgi:glutamate 5-kinase